MGITREQALDCFASDDLIGLGMEADAVRRSLHPEGVVTYVLEGDIDFSTAQETLFQQLKDLETAGGTGVLIRVSGADLEMRLAIVREQFPSLWLGGYSATSVVAMSRAMEVHPEELLSRLQAAGLESLGGADAGMLCEGLHREGCSVAEWLQVHRAAHALGLPSSATMTFGQGETMEQRVEHLEALRSLQDHTGGFTSFMPTGFQHDVTAGGRSLDEATSVEYLKTLAICRMYLGNIVNVQANWQVQTMKVVQMGVRFGGNDVGAAGHAPGNSEEDLRRVIRDAGFRPVQRDSMYRTLFFGLVWCEPARGSRTAILHDLGVEL